MNSNVNKYTFSILNVIARVLLFWVAFMLLLFLAGSFLIPFFPSNLERFIYGIFGTGAAMLVTWVFLQNEKNSFRAIGLVWEKQTLAKFFRGIIYGTLIIVLILSFLLVLTELKLTRNTNDISIWQILFYLSVIPLALMEEIAFRAYPFIRLEKAFGFRLTQIIVAIAFALYHILTGWDIYIAFLGPGIWALLFGLTARKTGGIAVPTGIHVALNVLQSLTGMKSGNYASIWILNYPEGTPENLIARADNVGLIIQLLILACLLVLTELYYRKKTAVY